MRQDLAVKGLCDLCYYHSESVVFCCENQRGGINYCDTWTHRLEFAQLTKGALYTLYSHTKEPMYRELNQAVRPAVAPGFVTSCSAYMQ